MPWRSSFCVFFIACSGRAERLAMTRRLIFNTLPPFEIGGRSASPPDWD
jgi:hypothetical protein